MRTPTVCAGLSLVVLLGAGCRTATVNNVPRAAIAAPANVTMQEMQDALAAGGQRAGWRMRELSPGQMRAEKIVNQHRALSEITYDTAGYSITLLAADNLLYNGRRVHKVYNNWVKELQKSIDDEMRFRYQ